MTVPQSGDNEFDVEDHAHPHISHSQQHQQQQPESFTQVVAELLLPRADSPHKHCAICDEQALTTTRQKRADERYCCTMVALTFIMLFICGMILGVFLAIYAKKARGS
jgi:hypothetical protein